MSSMLCAVYFEGHARKSLPQAKMSGECTDRHPGCVCVCVLSVMFDSLWQMSSLWSPQAVGINIAVDKKSPYPVSARHFHYHVPMIKSCVLREK